MSTELNQQQDWIGSGEEEEGDLAQVVVDEKKFGLRMADTAQGRNGASVLIEKMYSWRGYSGNHRLKQDSNRVTLIATHQGEVCGTLTIGLDSPERGILADELFKDEVDEYRKRGARVCEFTKFAFASHIQSQSVLAGLIHFTIIQARDVHGCTDMFIEVNPRHRRFYQNMLGFKQLGEPKHNPRVDAPAYLQWVSLAYMTEQIEKMAGKPAPPGERSLYPLFFSSREEEGIIGRLKEADRQAKERPQGDAA